MSQHDMNIANQGFPAFRSDLNNALAALVSTSSGATAPSTTFANQLWYDTANNKLKIRNEDNDAWIEILTLNQTTDALDSVAGLVIGTNVQAYDADTAKTDTAQTWTAAQTINSGYLKLAGSSSGSATLNAPAAASTYTYTMPAATTDIAGLAVAQSFTKGQRGAIVTLTDGATVTPDMADGNNFSLTLGGNRTLANPSNLTAGQSGSIFLVQDGTGSRTLAYGSYYDFSGGTAPTLTTTANAVDRIDYVVRSTTSIHCVFTANYS